VGEFGFILHPISLKEDVARKYPIARLAPERLLEWALIRMQPQVLSHITGVVGADGASAEGWFVGCPIAPRQFTAMPEEWVVERVAASCRLAAEAGSKIVGLGALTAVVGDAGRKVAERVEVPITTGNSYTVATAVEGLLKAAELMGHDPRGSTAAVVGATGSIGRVCANLLSEAVPHIILLGRDKGRLESVAAQLRGSARIDISVEPDRDLARADLVVTVTSAVDTVIEPAYLKVGAVVCDVARPRDVSRRVANERPDVLVIEGGVVAVPGNVNFGFGFGFPPGTAYACMVETMTLALEGRYEPFTLGRELDIERVREIERLAQKHGFRLAGFRSFERALTDDQIARAREEAEKRRRSSSHRPRTL
jgi:predicted amino acid dehydrogenase